MTDPDAAFYAELERYGEPKVRGLHAVKNWGGNGPKVDAWLYMKEQERSALALRTAVASAEASSKAARWAMWAAIATAIGSLATWVQIVRGH